MFKKVIAIMTASILAASMLVGCGGSTGARQQRQLAAISQTRKSASASISSLITS